MVYIFDDIDSCSDKDLIKGLSLVSLQRQQKATSFTFALDRKLSVIAYLLLMYGLRNEYAIYDKPIFLFSDNEKPLLKDFPNIYFNISHCKKAVACAISQNSIGIDVEELSSYQNDLSLYVNNHHENEKIQSSDNPAEEFCRLWTKKEAILKLTGMGMIDDTKNLIAQNLDICTHTSVFSQKGYALSYSSYIFQTETVIKVNNTDTLLDW